ncbi:MAG: metal ABC transporter permease [bacterium]|nr:metal ABC transporter permease [bacterium]
MFEFVYQALADWHHYDPAEPKALLAGVMVSTVCGVIGCFIVLNRTAFLADALAHSMLAGVVCGYLLMKKVFGVEASAPAMVLGSLFAGLTTVVMVNFVSRFTRVKEDTAIGAMYTGIFALGGVLLSYFSDDVHIDIVHFLMGQILGVSVTDLWMMAGVASAVLVFVTLFYRQLQLVSFDPVMAASIGVHVGLTKFALTASTSLVVVSGVHIVGVILVVGMLIIPAATAYLLSDKLNYMLWLAAMFGVTGFFGGYFFAVQLNVAPGSAVVLALAVQFMGVFFFAPRYGYFADWLRRRRMVPQQVIEDVLGSVRRSGDQPPKVREVLANVHSSPHIVNRAIRRLLRDELLEEEGGRLSLTETGYREARRLMRAHRLWETYLQHVGAPSDELHDKAHVLEHIHDEDAVDYLDDKLGHPVRDPHGSEIPEDFVHLPAGGSARLSLLRRGRTGAVLSIEEPADSVGLTIGEPITLGPRREADNHWVVIRETGETLYLNHEQADAVFVQLSEDE